jgi:hypothetical protein
VSLGDGRYARQVSVRGIGEAGQAAFARASVEIAGTALDAELCALYLAGAGVGHLVVDPCLVDGCRALNSDVHVEPRSAGDALGLVIDLGGTRAELPSILLTTELSPVARGAAAARWALARVLAALHDGRG